MSDEKPKIYVDDDWKKQAQEEKHRLAEEQEAAEAEKPADQAPAGEMPALPEPSIMALISSFATQAMISMGAINHPDIKEAVNFDLAKFNIGMLEMLEEKTKGNLTTDEHKALDETLHQIRMAFVELSSKSGPIG